LIYVDTSFIAPFYIQEATSETVEEILLNLPTQELAISDWTVVEFASLPIVDLSMLSSNSEFLPILVE
jgi:uncharacterized protein